MSAFGGKADIKRCSEHGDRRHGRDSSGNLAILAAKRASSLAADRRPRRTSKAISAIQKSWKSSPRHESSFYRLVGDFFSQDLLVSLVRVFLHRMGPVCATLRRHDKGGGAFAPLGTFLRRGKYPPEPQGSNKRATHGSFTVQHVAQITALNAMPFGKSAYTSFLLDCCFEQQNNVLFI